MKDKFLIATEEFSSFTIRITTERPGKLLAKVPPSKLIEVADAYREELQLYTEDPNQRAALFTARLLGKRDE